MSVTYPEIVVIVGTGRSGTTYLCRVLKQSMDIGFSSEPKFVMPLHRRLSRYGDLERPANLRNLVDEIHRGQMFRHLHRVIGIDSRPEDIIGRIREPTYTGVLYAVFQTIADKRGNARVGYKDPVDAIHLPTLARLLPTARFVNILRDGRDVAHSYLKFKWGPTNLYSAARSWSRVVTTSRRDGAALGDRYHEVRLEDLVQNTSESARTLGEFVNRGRDRPQVDDLVNRIEKTKQYAIIDEWKRELNLDQRYVCEAAAAETLAACGYEIEFDGRFRGFTARAPIYLGADFLHRVRNRLGDKLQTLRA